MAGRRCGLLGGVEGAPEKVAGGQASPRGEKGGFRQVSRPAGQQVRRQQKAAQVESQEQLEWTTGLRLPPSLLRFE